MKRTLRENITDAALDLGSWARAVADMARPVVGAPSDPYPQRERDQERRLVERLHPSSMTLRLEERVQETPTTVTLRLARTDGELPPFAPGQYVSLEMELDGTRTSRPYSIASAPGSPLLELTIKEKPGGFVSPYLCRELAVGHTLKSSGPQGWFRQEPLIDPSHLVLLAGGSGITPFMSMLRHRSSTGAPAKITLLYGCRTEQEVIFAKELRALERAQDGLEIFIVLSEPPDGFAGQAGLLDEELLRVVVGDAEDRLFFICGPEPMIPFCRQAVEATGAPAHRVRVETFGPPEQVTTLAGWPEGLSADHRFTVEVEGHGPLEAAAGEPLLNTLERAGLVVPATCRVGACSACRSRLLQGEVFCPDTTGVRQWDRENGYIHPCMAYPLTNLRLRLP